MEDRYQLTRSTLEVVLKHRFPVLIITKSDLIERDFDLLSEIDKSAILPVDLSRLARGVIVSFSFSTIKDGVSRIFEPGAVKPSIRLGAVQKTLDAGFLTGVCLMLSMFYRFGIKNTKGIKIGKNVIAINALARC